MTEQPAAPAFQELMVDALHANYNVAGKIVVEIASDPWLLAARRLLTHGAERVIASDVTEGWAQESDSRVEIAVIDARQIDEVLGKGSVDVVMGINLLEHLEDIPTALRSIDSALRPGGFCFLHGHPIWTSARGHHAMLGYRGADFTFSDDSNPIPPWGHLYMTETEMRRELAAAGCLQPVIEAATYWSYHINVITRLPQRRIAQEIEAGPLRVEAVWRDRLEPPSETDLIRIKHSPWWDEGEDYAVRALTFLLRKE